MFIYLESYTINEYIDYNQITKNYKQQRYTWLAGLLNLVPQSIYFLPSSPFLFSKHSNICFAIIFYISTFPL